MAFYKLAPGDIVVIHDEVDLPPGKTRMKAGGGTAGHNGLRSVGAEIGEDFRRLRIGVGHPGVKEAVPHYVLHDFPKADAVWLAPLIDAIAEHAPLLTEGKDPTFANRLHAITEPTKVDEPAKTAPPKTKEAPAKEKAGGPLARNLKKLFGL